MEVILSSTGKHVVMLLIVVVVEWLLLLLMLINEKIVPFRLFVPFVMYMLLTTLEIMSFRISFSYFRYLITNLL